MNLDRTYDLVVVGGGNAALASAISAAETAPSRKILLIERAPGVFRGGNSKYTRSIRYVHDHDDYSNGPYTREEYVKDIYNATKGETSPQLLDKIVDGSANLPAWMSRHKVVLKKAVKGAFHYSTANAFILGGGKQLVNTYYDVLGKLGVSVAYETTVTDITRNEHNLVSLDVRNGTDSGRITTDGIIVASGGYEANLDWLKESYGERADNIVVRGNKYNDGIPIKALFRMGAKHVGRADQAHWTAVDARSPKFDGGFVTRIDLIPLGIVVNREAKRFYDEGEDLWTKRYVIWGHLVRDQPGQVAFVIIERRMLGETLVPMYRPIEGNTLEELALKLKLDPTALVTTVREFNQHISRTKEYDLSKLDGRSTSGLAVRKSNWSRAIEEPPFLAWPLLAGITFTYLGAAIDLDSRVLQQNGQPFENVYAAGELISGNIYGRGYVGGTGLVIGSVTGITAGKEALRND